MTTSADGTVRQWDAATGREVLAPYERHIGDVVTAVYSPDGLWIASAGTDRTIRVWEAANRHDVAVLHGHTGVVTDLAFTADGRRLASTSQSGRQEFTCDGTVRLWEVTRNADASVLRGHTSYIYPVAYSPDGQWIASGGWDNTVRLWDAATGESSRCFPILVRCERWPSARIARGWSPHVMRIRRYRSGASRPARSRKRSSGPGALLLWPLP